MPTQTSKCRRALDADKSQYVPVPLNPPQIEIVNRLYRGGMHGNTCAEVVRRLFADGCQPHARPCAQPEEAK